jgi:hypothetical protein
MNTITKANVVTNYSSQLSQLTDAILNSEQQLDSYCHNYFGGHSQALEAIFPCTLAMMGHNTFSALALVYVRHYPAKHWDINLYGDGFSDFIAAQVMGPKANKVDWQLLAAVSGLEYAITCVYYAGSESCTGDQPLVVKPVAIDALAPAALFDYHPYVDCGSIVRFNHSIYLWRHTDRIQIANNTRQLEQNPDHNDAINP